MSLGIVVQFLFLAFSTFAVICEWLLSCPAIFTLCNCLQYPVSWLLTLSGHDGNKISTPTGNQTLVVQPVAR